MNLSTKTNGGFTQGMLLLPLGQYKSSIVAVYVCRKVLSTATRVGSQQSADPQKGNAQAKKPSRIPRQQPFLESPASDGILDQVTNRNNADYLIVFHHRQMAYPHLGN